jgi:galactose mutarotase-like enzyme
VSESAEGSAPPSQPAEATWGAMRAVRLADAALSVVVVPRLGGRVVSLRDERSGREWLTQGPPPDPEEASAWGSEDAVFTGRVSYGWDECLPTVAPCVDPLNDGAAPLRDHGDQWGRPADLVADGSGITTTWTSPRWPYRFTRRLHLEVGGTLHAAYELVSLSDRPVPLLWSMHPTVALEPGSVIELPGVDRVRLTWTTGSSLAAGESVAWPMAPARDGSRVELGRVRSADGSAAKMYAATPGPARLRADDGAVLELTWDRTRIPAVGVWIDLGGWPTEGRPVQQVALEPTSSPDDDLADAVAHDRAWSLPAGGTARWWVRLSSRLARGDT